MSETIPGGQRYSFANHRLALEVARTEGCHLIRPVGRRILDAAGGAFVLNHDLASILQRSLSSAVARVAASRLGAHARWQR